MKPWQALAAILPAGLLLGLAGGQASRPEMKFHQMRPWPQSVQEHGERIEAWQPIYEAGPQNPSPAAYSYRPDLDYDAYFMPPQEAVIGYADLTVEPGVADDTPVFATSYPGEAPEQPIVHRATAERAARRAAEAAQDAAAAADAAATEKAAPEIAEAEPLALSETVPPPVAPIETRAF